MSISIVGLPYLRRIANWLYEKAEANRRLKITFIHAATVVESSQGRLFNIALWKSA